MVKPCLVVENTTTIIVTKESIKKPTVVCTIWVYRHRNKLHFIFIITAISKLIQTLYIALTTNKLQRKSSIYSPHQYIFFVTSLLSALNNSESFFCLTHSCIHSPSFFSFWFRRSLKIPQKVNLSTWLCFYLQMWLLNHFFLLRCEELCWHVAWTGCCVGELWFANVVKKIPYYA